MAKSNVTSGSQYTAASNEKKAFNLPAKPSNTTAPQPQPATNNPSASVRKVTVDKTPEICLSNIWKYCKFGGRCNDMHYYLPYRWQEFKGTDWADLPNIEDIEMAYSNPMNIRYQSINFQTMTLGTSRVRRLTTPSSVTQPSEYVLTTEWVWFWKDEFGTWIKYGESNTKKVSSSIYSSDLENIYLSDPTGSTHFSAGGQNYIINFKEMRQRNNHYQTEKEVCRRPKFLDFQKVKMLKGSTKSAADSSARKSLDSLLKGVNYPSLWDTKAVPETGYQRCSIVSCMETALISTAKIVQGAVRAGAAFRIALSHAVA
ncbi:PREDICTED: poly [ADP-ribose] polymerase 12-like [Nanorana parkeri]|uniref:poly [ADP-ribose] polymerase 12-like n=1 Tax=Nanorana parkeri TaxID=125878 RepID=UPI000854DBE2|nr:PREDICTED: poly [ADP-ribose] polymerase 12-like [Nanorana parkeri]